MKIKVKMQCLWKIKFHLADESEVIIRYTTITVVPWLHVK